MLGYNWSTKKDVNSVHKMLELTHGTTIKERKLFVKKFFLFTILLFLEPKELDFVSMRTNTKHYVRHTTILIGFFKTKGEFTHFIGLSFFDILDRLFFVILTLLGVWYVSSSFLSGVVLSAFVYLILFLLAKEDDRQKLISIKNFINWDSQQQ